MSFDPQNPPPKNPYATPNAGAENVPSHRPVIGPKPQVMIWQKIYLGFMVALYIAVAIMGIALFVFANEIAADDPDLSPNEMQIAGVIYGIMGVALAVLFGLGFVFSKGNGGWIFNTVLIALGLTSCCCWPATIPLLIYWVQQREQILHYS